MERKGEERRREREGREERADCDTAEEDSLWFHRMHAQ